MLGADFKSVEPETASGSIPPGGRLEFYMHGRLGVDLEDRLRLQFLRPRGPRAGVVILRSLSRRNVDMLGLLHGQFHDCLSV